MDENSITLELHEQRILSLEKNLAELKEVQTEIKAMNETLVTLANELKHTNEHLERHEKKIIELDEVPKQKYRQIYTAFISAIIGGIVTYIIQSLIGR